jgi:FixJ family two-component response regulator
MTGNLHRQTVFVVDDDPSVRDALTLLLSLHGHACASFASAEDFLGSLQPAWRGCVVADIRMSGMSGLQLQARLKEKGLPLAVVVVTAHGDVAAARQAFMADAVDFIEKPFDGEQLLAAVQAGLARVRTADASAADAPLSMPDSAHAQPSSSVRDALQAALSPREHEVMQLLVQGLHNRQIAEELGISHRTVEVHKARVLEKFGARSVVELVRLVDRSSGS